MFKKFKDVVKSKIAYHHKRRKYYSNLKALQREYCLECWYDRKCVNRDWKIEWKPFIKYDNDYDFSFILRLFIYKLKKTHLYFSFFSHVIDEDKERIVETLQRTIDLGEKVLNFDYDTEAYDFMTEHTKAFVDILPKEGIEMKMLARVYAEDYGIPREEAFLNPLPGKTWCEVNGVDPSTVRYAYGTEWDNDSSRKSYNDLYIKAENDKQKNLDDFFLSISRNLQFWWD